MSLVVTGACGESDDKGAFETKDGASSNCPVGSLGCPCTKGRSCDPPGECDVVRFRCVAPDAAGGSAGASGAAGRAGSGGTGGLDASGDAGGSGGMSGAGGDDGGGASGSAGQSGTAGVGGSDGGLEGGPPPCKKLDQPCTVKAECCAPYVCSPSAAQGGRTVCSLLTCKSQTCEESQCKDGGWMPVTAACPRAKIVGCTKCTPRCDATLGCTCLCAETSCFHQDVCELRCPADC